MATLPADQFRYIDKFMSTEKSEAARTDWRGEHTRMQLIETAESLFSQQGIDAVSLRKIGVAVGSSNTNIVGYHFGTKEDLINAIFEHRLPWLDSQREALYRKCVENNQRDLEHLLYAMWWPLYEQKNDEGHHSYAGFLSELLRSGRGELRRAVGHNYLAAESIVADMAKAIPELPKRVLEERLHIAANIVTTILRTIDRLDSRSKSEALSDQLFFDGLAMAAAALAAPVGEKASLF